MYLALDPGETTGYASFGVNGDSIDIGEVFSDAELDELLDMVKPTVVIIEDWVQSPYVTMGGNKQLTARTIGSVESWARRHNAKVVLQPNTIKSIGYKWAGIPKPKTKSLSHRSDAYVHGVYYLQKQGIRYPQQGRAQ
jgi:hypothetical protein